MTVSPAIRAALEAARDALGAIITDAPKARPTCRNEYGMYDLSATNMCAMERWDAAEKARPAFQQINAALAEMEAQS